MSKILNLGVVSFFWLAGINFGSHVRAQALTYFRQESFDKYFNTNILQYFNYFFSVTVAPRTRKQTNKPCSLSQLTFSDL